MRRSVAGDTDLRITLTRDDEGRVTAVTVGTKDGEPLEADGELDHALNLARLIVRSANTAQWKDTEGTHLKRALRSSWHGRVTDEYLAVLSLAYCLLSKHTSMKVVPTLAEYLDRPANTIRMHLVRARDRGLLTGEVGKAVGELTDRATEVLESATTAGPDGPFPSEAKWIIHALASTRT